MNETTIVSSRTSKLEDVDRKNGLLILCLGFFVFGLLSTVIGVTVPNIKQEFGVTNEQAGMVFVYWSAGVLFGAYIGGKAFYFVKVRTLFIATALSSIACLVLLHGEENLVLYKIYVFLLSLSGSLFFTAGHATAARVGNDNKVSILSFMDFLLSVGSLSTPFLVNYFTASSNWSGKGWRHVFLVAAALLGITMVLATRVDAGEGSNASTSQADNRSKDVGTPSQAYLAVLTDPMFLIFMLGSLFLHATEWGHSVWFVTYATEVVGLTPERARETFSLFLIGMATSRLLSSWLIWIFKPTTLMAILISITTVAAISILDYRSYAALCVLNFMFGFGFGPTFPLLLGLSMERAPAKSAMLSGIGLMSGTMGAKGISYLIGLVADHSSLAQSYRYVSWATMALLLVVLAFLSVHIRSKTPQPEVAPATTSNASEPDEHTEAHVQRESGGSGDVHLEFSFGPSLRALYEAIPKLLWRSGTRQHSVDLASASGSPAVPSRRDYLRRLLLDRDLQKEFEALFGERRRIPRAEADRFLNLVWEKYPLAKDLYPNPNEILAAADRSPQSAVDNSCEPAMAHRPQALPGGLPS